MGSFKEPLSRRRHRRLACYDQRRQTLVGLPLTPDRKPQAPAEAAPAAAPARDSRDEALRQSSSFPTTRPSATFEKTTAWRRAWPWVAAVGLLLTAFLTALTQRSVDQLERRHLLHAARGLEAGLTHRLSSFEQRLGWALRFLDARDRIPNGWSRVLLSVNPSTRPQGRVTVGYAAYVPMPETAAFEADARRRIASRFVIKPGGKRPAVAPVLFFDPPLLGSDPLGFDLLTEPALASALEAARDTATARLSDRTSFGRQRGAGTGIVLVLPVFDGASGDDVEARRLQVRGFLLAPLESADLAPQTESAESGPIQYSLYASGTPGYESLLFGSSAKPILPHPQSVTHPLELGGRPFTLVAVSAPQGRGWLGIAAFWVPLVSGLLATLFAALHAHHRGANRGALSALDQERAAARDTDTRVRALVDYVTQAIITYGDDGLIQTYNRAAETMFGYPPSQVIGWSIDRILPRGPSTRHQKLTLTEAAGVRANGIRFAAEISVVPVAGAGAPLYVALISDVTDRRIAAKQLAAQLALTRVMAESANLESAAPSILRSVAQGFDGSAAALWLVNREAGHLERFAVWALTADDERALRASGDSRLARGHGLAGRVWATGQPGHLTDRWPLGEDERATVPLATRIALPLAGRKGVVGVIEFVTPRFDPDPARLDAMLRIAGREVGQFVERKHIEAALVESEARYRELFEAAPGLIQSTDARGRWLFANRAWRETLGYTASEVEGLEASQVVAPASRAVWEKALAAATGKAGTGEMEITLRTKDGREVVVAGTLITREVRGAITSLGIFRDVTAQRNVERMKQDFVSTVSHELRTPLASIHGSLGLLSAGALGDLPEDAAEAVAIAERNVVRLLDLINDILDLERLRSGRLAMTFAPTEMSEIVDRSIDAVQAFLVQKRMRIERLPVSGRAFADPDRVVQVLINLLSNAAKFSPPATTITLASLESGGWLKVSVGDEGPGIPAGERTAVFERFRRGAGRGATAKGGTGLGLAICKAIVEEHGGTIGVESEEGRGSTFWFEVPAVEVRLDDAAAHHSR